MSESTDRVYKVLFLCTGNFARSVMGEYLLNRAGKGCFETYSAGADPKDEVHPMTKQILRDFFKINSDDARSKSWEEFKEDKDLDFVITVCDNAKENWPVFPRRPIQAHWRSEDPAAFEGPDDKKLQYFREIVVEINRRCELFICLPIGKIDCLKPQESIENIARESQASVTSSFLKENYLSSSFPYFSWYSSGISSRMLFRNMMERIT